MSIFATLHASAPAGPREAMARAFPGREIPAQPPFRIVLDALDATAVTPGKPNFLAESLGFDPAISVHFTLSKTALPAARRQLADAVRAFLAAPHAGAPARLVLLYIDTPVIERNGTAARVRRGYEDLAGSEGWRVVDELTPAGFAP